MDRLDLFTAAALSGLASMDHDRHGHTAPTHEDLGRRAVEMARGAVLALEDLETEPAPTRRPVFATPPQAALEMPETETKPAKSRGR